MTALPTDEAGKARAPLERGTPRPPRPRRTTTERLLASPVVLFAAAALAIVAATFTIALLVHPGIHVGK